jgi:imidazolonepropionase-like amidohydrolase
MFELRKISALLILLIPLALNAQQETPSQTLITNVNIFDGFSDKLANGMSVLIEDNQIVEVGKSISAPNATVIDGGGRTMTPGLIDMHQHVMLNPPEGTASYQTRWDGAAGGAFAIHHLNKDMLMKSTWACFPGRESTHPVAQSLRPAAMVTGPGAMYQLKSLRVTWI